VYPQYRFMKHIITSIIGLFIVLSVYSQNITIDTLKSNSSYEKAYKSAIGVKMYPSAVTYKQFIRTNKAVEALGYFSLDGFRATILYETYAPIEGNENLSWYVGYGGHLGIWSETWKKNNPDHTAGIAVGVDGILGLDYKVKNIPLNISVDWQPSFNFVGSSYFESGWAGIGIRYTF